MTKWNYVPATHEEKVKVHPTVVTYKTLEGTYVSIYDASDELVQKGVEVYEAFVKFCKDFDIGFHQDSEYGGLGFTLDEFSFNFDGIETEKIYILRIGHIVGTIYRIQDEDA